MSCLTIYNTNKQIIIFTHCIFNTRLHKLVITKLRRLLINLDKNIAILI